MSFFIMLKFAGIVFSLMSLAVIVSGVVETSPLHCKRSAESFKTNVAGEWKHSVRFPLIHVDSECSPYRPANRTWESLINDRIKVDVQRVSNLDHYLSSSRSSNIRRELDARVPVQSGVSTGSGSYLVSLGFGTPQQKFSAIMDTGSDIIWVVCTQCQGCDKTSTPFDSTKSSTFQSLDCSTSKLCTGCGANSECLFGVQYIDGSNVTGPLVSDTITLGTQTYANYSFGCAQSAGGTVTNQAGLVGLGGGASSLLGQPAANSFDQTFSYCLPTFSSSSASGSLVLGKGPVEATGLTFTPLIQDASTPTFYMVNLNKISVGNTTVDVPTPAEGGTVVDSGTTLTILESSVYTEFRDAFRAEVSNSDPRSVSPFDTCYDTSFDAPSVTLHFDNVDLALPRENVVTEAESGTECLAFTGSQSTSILGNIQQQNYLVVFDVPNSQVGFVQQKCSS